MGFSVSMAFAIFLVGLLALSTILVSSYDYRSGLIDNAERVRHERMVKELQTDLEIITTDYDAVQDILTIDVKNTGSTVLNASKVDVLLDGELETANITSLKVNGVDSSVWSPEDTLQIKISGVAANPTRIKVIAENGISDYYGS